MHTDMHTHTQAHAHTHTGICTHILSHTHTLIYPHTFKHTHSYTHTHSHTLSHTHTHSLSLSFPLFLLPFLPLLPSPLSVIDKEWGAVKLSSLAQAQAATEHTGLEASAAKASSTQYPAASPRRPLVASTAECAHSTSLDRVLCLRQDVPSHLSPTS